MINNASGYTVIDPSTMLGPSNKFTRKTLLESEQPEAGIAFLNASRPSICSTITSTALFQEPQR